MFKYHYILVLFFVHTAFPSLETPDYIKFCNSKCPSKLKAFHDITHSTTNRDVIRIPALQACYVFHKYEKGSNKLYKKTDWTDNNNNNQIACYVAPTVCRSKKNK